MPHEQNEFTHGDQEPKSEALSNELLKLKIDDLFQEIESLKDRVACLESAARDKLTTNSGDTTDLKRSVVSDPDDSVMT